MDTAWETELATLLSELSSVQDELLDVLTKKRQFLVNTDVAGMQSLGAREQALVERLQACQQHRSRLLERAGQQGLPRGSIRALAAALPTASRKELSAIAASEPYELGARPADFAAFVAIAGDYCYRRPNADDIWKRGIRSC
jgi:hypothetical protein